MAPSGRTAHCTRRGDCSPNVINLAVEGWIPPCSCGLGLGALQTHACPPGGIEFFQYILLQFRATTLVCVALLCGV